MHLAHEVAHASERVGVGVHDELDAVVERDELGVGDDARDLHDHVVVDIRPVISRSIHTNRLSPLVCSLGSGTRRTLPARGAQVDSPPMTAPATAWRPDAELLHNSNVARFMTAEGIGDFPELVARSIDDPEWFWDAVVEFLGIQFSKPYERVLDTADGIPWAKWFVGGRAEHRDHVCRPMRPAADDSDEPAVVWEGEDGDVTRR